MTRSETRNDGVLTIGRLAESAGVPVDTVRYYLRRGLLSEPSRSAGNYREFSREDSDRLRLIVQAKTAGFTLGEIGTLLDSLDADDLSCSDLRSAVRRKIGRLEQGIRRSRESIDHLAGLLDRCDCNGRIDGVEGMRQAMVDSAADGPGCGCPGTSGDCCAPASRAAASEGGTP